MCIKDTLALLKKVILDENCERMNKSTVKGFYGELIIKQLLENNGLTVKHLGNQAGYDLEIIPGGAKIDVKMSLPKNELKLYNVAFNEKGYYWGWALKHVNKKKISATHLVCLGFDNELTPQIVVIIPASEVVNFPHGVGQFSRVEHALIIPTDEYELSSDKEKIKCFIDKCNKAMCSLKIRSSDYNQIGKKVLLETGIIGS